MLHMLQGVFEGSAFPEGIAVTQNHVAGVGNVLVIGEFVIGIDVAHRHPGEFCLHVADEAEKFFFGEVFPVEDFVADGGHIDISVAGQGDEIGDFLPVFLLIPTQPGPHQRFQAHFLCHHGNDLISLDTGKGTDPLRIGL